MRVLDPNDVNVVRIVEQLAKDQAFLALMEHFTTRLIPQMTRELVLTPGGDARDWASGRIATIIEITEAIRQYREAVRNPPKANPGANAKWP